MTVTFQAFLYNGFYADVGESFRLQWQKWEKCCDFVIETIDIAFVPSALCQRILQRDTFCFLINVSIPFDLSRMYEMRSPQNRATYADITMAFENFLRVTFELGNFAAVPCHVRELKSRRPNKAKAENRKRAIYARRGRYAET